MPEVIKQGETKVFQASRAPALHDGADHTEEKQPAVFVLEIKRTTNKHE